MSGIGDYAGFRPEVTEIDAPFWEGVRSGRLLLQVCGACGAHRFPPSLMCPRCHARAAGWTEAAGRGTVYSFTVVRRAPTPAYDHLVPYVLAQVELEEGVRITSTLADPEGVRVGAAVRVVFEQAAPDLVLYRLVLV
jgi:uncharacterized OB-fold protein